MHEADSTLIDGYESGDDMRMTTTSFPYITDYPSSYYLEETTAAYYESISSGYYLNREEYTYPTPTEPYDNAKEVITLTARTPFSRKKDPFSVPNVSGETEGMCNTVTNLRVMIPELQALSPDVLLHVHGVLTGFCSKETLLLDKIPV